MDQAKDVGAWSYFSEDRTAVMLGRVHRLSSRSPNATYTFRADGSDLKMMVCFQLNYYDWAHTMVFNIKPLDEARVQIYPTKVVNYSSIKDLVTKVFDLVPQIYPYIDVRRFTFIGVNCSYKMQ